MVCRCEFWVAREAGGLGRTDRLAWDVQPQAQVPGCCKSHRSHGSRQLQFSEFWREGALEKLACSRDAGRCLSESISGDSCLIPRPSGQLGHTLRPHVTSAARTSPGEPAGFPKAFFFQGLALPLPPPAYSKIRGPFPHASVDFYLRGPMPPPVPSEWGCLEFHLETPREIPGALLPGMFTARPKFSHACCVALGELPHLSDLRLPVGRSQES